MSEPISAEPNAAAQKWFLDHHQEVPEAKWYAVGPEGLIAHGDTQESITQAVVASGRSLADKSLLFVCLCGPEGCCK